MGKKPKCSQRNTVNALGHEQAATCFKHATQRIVMQARIVHRCPEHEMDDEFVESQGWTAWKIEDAA